ncbi:hypothetical protein [Vibrio splendidus]|uniref:hypothetical protein n=1 Tax=Vibrio splendidus TaxID=29497 RepID=UPI000D3C85CC|nr:hypothetical protein [Vibrio splendidus]PTP95469.1 hypothetical protein CWO02_01100 [Vibrio splendidus]
MDNMYTEHYPNTLINHSFNAIELIQELPNHELLLYKGNVVGINADKGTEQVSVVFFEGKGGEYVGTGLDKATKDMLTLADLELNFINNLCLDAGIRTITGTSVSGATKEYQERVYSLSPFPKWYQSVEYLHNKVPVSQLSKLHASKKALS